MALLSSFQPNEALLADHVGLFRGLMVAGGIGTILTAGYFLWMLQRVNMGTMPERWNEHALGDMNTIEWASWTPLLVLILTLRPVPAPDLRHQPGGRERHHGLPGGRLTSS